MPSSSKKRAYRCRIDLNADDAQHRGNLRGEIILKRFAMTVALLACITAAGPALSQSYPVKPVRLVVPFAPGNSSDIMARALAQKLSELWRQSVVVENKPGATTTIGTELVAKSAPDGYTLLLAPPSFVVSPHVYSKLNYNRARDLTPVSLVAFYPLILVVNAANPAKDMAELIAQAKAKPGMMFGSVGNGSMGHLAGELVHRRTGVEMVHVPYKSSGQAAIDLIGGLISFYFSGAPEVLSHIRNGKINALAVLAPSGKRLSLLPAVPTAQESGFPEIEAVLWAIVVAPAGTPQNIVDRISSDIARVVSIPEFRDRFITQGAELVGSTADEAAQFIRSEDAKWGPLVKSLGVRAE